MCLHICGLWLTLKDISRTEHRKTKKVHLNSTFFVSEERKFFHFRNFYTVMPGCYPGLIWWRYTSFPSIHVNFPITSKCVLKATVHRKKKQWVVLPYLRIFFFKKKLLWYCTSMLYLINVSIISRSVRIFHVSLSMIYQLFSPHHVLYTRFFLNIHKGFFL